MNTYQMTKEKSMYGEPNKNLSMHPHKFALWLFLVTVIMVFASLTSYYIVRKSDGNWLEFDLPANLWMTSGIILLSSATMHWAYYSAKRDDFQKLKLAILLTTLLGFGFLFGQFSAWEALYEGGIVFAGKQSNVAGSLLYLLSGLHGVHVIAGLIFLMIVTVRTFSFKVHSKNMLSIEMCATLWHFLGALWIYLFVFLLLNH